MTFKGIRNQDQKVKRHYSFISNVLHVKFYVKVNT